MATHDVAFVVVHDKVADVPLGIVIVPPFEAVTPFAFPLTVKLRVGEVGGGGGGEGHISTVTDPFTFLYNPSQEKEIVAVFPL